ncbi:MULTISPECIES: PAS domain-containing protein [unclassified Rhizobium]|uniref:hypothetical protein n=1 Tax=unclassified Rhizobium TaxID=2613769 RepID=UPI001ADBFBC5|nr:MULTISPECIES: hypothetical protein [unclassified Rhizobium]MBO9127778.1 hypothetical protein [Rhizobium sp. 16-488-2b]MBO9178240.1 hypothetical protein [Rhizobium sp. 16-488-2a]
MLRNDLRRGGGDEREMPAEYGVYAWDIAADLFRMDATLCRYIGVDPNIGEKGVSVQSFAAFIHPADRGSFIAAIEASARSGSKLRHIFRLEALNGPGGKLRAAGHSFLDREQSLGICTGLMFRTNGNLQASSETELADHCIAAYEFAKKTNSSMVQYLMSMALIELGYQIAGFEKGSVQ